MRGRTFALALTAAIALPLVAEAQDTTRATQPVRRRQAPIEIRGQVPTPQVVTVRPREVPAYSRQVLVPNFYDHDFWPSILPAYQLVPKRMVTGTAPLDSATVNRNRAAADTMRLRTRTPSDSVRQNVAPPAGQGGVTPGTSQPPATGTPAPPSGTPPASTTR